MADGKVGAPKGNRNAAGSRKDWQDAIRRVLGKDRGSLERCAKALVRAAEEGDIAALKEIGDRLDGKPKQEVGLETTLTVVGRVSDEPMDPQEWLDQAKAAQTTYQ